MLPVDLQRLAPAPTGFRRRRRAVTLRAIAPTLAAELSFRRAVHVVMNRFMQSVREELPELLLSLQAELRRELIHDTVDRLEFVMRRARNRMAQDLSTLEAVFGRIFSAEDERYRREFGKAIQGSFRLDLTPFMQGADVQAHLQASVQQSVSLIKGLTDELAKRVEQTILSAGRRDVRPYDLQRTLVKLTGWSKEQAKFIAKDQLATFNGIVNQIRQTQFGIDEYQWSTQLDAKVRPEHQEREGVIYRWDTPPEGGQHPGLEINCRCVARAVIRGRVK